MSEKFGNSEVTHELENKVRKSVQLAIRSELTGIMIVLLSTEDKLEKKGKIQQSLKYYKAALKDTLNVEQQTLTPQALLNPILATKIAAALKLK